MHELSIMESVLTMVRDSAEQSHINKVNKIRLVIGKLTMVMPDSLHFCFEVLSQEDLFRDAVLEIEEKETLMHCGICDNSFAQDDGLCFVCPSCGSSPVEILTGREMYLDYYEGENN